MNARHHPAKAFQMLPREEHADPDRWKPLDLKYLETVLPESKHTDCLYHPFRDEYYCRTQIPAQRSAT